jgi:hypothetical protein
MLQSPIVRVLGAALALVLFAGLPPAAAQGLDLFTVSKVPVDATAADAVAARRDALKSGQEEALNRLLRRLVPAEHHGRLPAASALPIDRFVQNFQIAGEQRSATRYLAELTVGFSPERVRELLQSRSLPFAQTPSETLVVLPVFEGPEGAKLWADGNPWWQAWAESLDPERLLRLQLPRGDSDDQNAITAEQARVGDSAALDRIARRYGSGEVLVVTASPQTAYAASDQPPAEPVVVRLAARRSGSVEKSGTAFDLNGAPGQPLDQVLAAAVTRMQDNLDEQWKTANLLRLDQGGLIFVDIPIKALQDWVEINQGLLAMPEVSEVEIDTFARDLVQAQIHYVGDQIGFEDALARLDLRLSREGDAWRLQPTVADPTLGQVPSATTSSY